MTKQIIIVEDEKAIADILEFNLKKEGFSVYQYNNGKDGLEAILNNSPDLVLLDVMLPIIDGFEILKTVRTKSNVPIIMLTAREEEEDKILGLENGADDYITKPFSMKELIARVRANTRRITEEKAVTNDNISVLNSDVSLDNDRCLILKNGEEIEITSREFEIVKCLTKHSGKIFSREELMKEVWGYEYFGDARAVDVAIRRLREKIEENPAKPVIIMTKRGQGYFFSN